MKELGMPSITQTPAYEGKKVKFGAEWEPISARSFCAFTFFELNTIRVEECPFSIFRQQAKG
jgi:hypothetical protein